MFYRARDLYINLVGYTLVRKLRFLVVFLLITAALGLLFRRMPTAYLPNEDQGSMYSQVLLPAGSTLERNNFV